MSTYREIVGKKIKKVSSDPSSGLDGEMWYNSTTGTLRGPALVSAWSSSAPLSTDRYAMGCGGTQTASVAAGGGIAAPPYVTAAVEEYNGSGWSTAPSLNTARGGLGSSKNGSQTAMLVFGGTSNSTATESFNGSAWTTTPNSLTTGKSQTSGAGTQGSALNAGRWGPPMIGNTEEWDGSSWSEQEDLNTARGDMACFGTQTAAIFAGGNSSSPPNYRNLAEQYDGSSWTVLPTLNTARGAGGSGAGSTTSGLVFGGNTPGPAASNASESWDGTSWTNTPNLAEAGARVGNGATGSAALAVGDYPITGVTEEYNSSTNTITAGAWASAPAIGTGRYLLGYGTNTPTSAAIIFGGQSTTSTSNTETFDGSSWSEQPDMNTARSRIKGFGTSTAIAVTGGRQVGTPVGTMDDTEEYNGSSWTSVTNYPSDNRGIGGAGTQTAGLAIGGNTPATANVFDYDGTNWTAAEGNLNTARGYVSGWGPQSAAGSAGGSVSPNKQYEEYNGSSWTSKSSLIVSGDNISGSGSNPSAIFASGNAQPVGQAWNGTAWSTAPSRGTGSVGGNAAAGIASTSALIAGGYVYPSTGATTASEEFTGATSAVNIEDFTTS